MRRAAITLLTLLSLPPGAAASVAAPAGAGAAPLSDRIVSYRIDVTLDPAAHTLKGRERLTWRNATSHAAAELRFHLYLNAFKNNRSTFMKESGGVNRGNRLREDGWGFIDVTSLRRDDGADLLAGAAFVSPDDANPDDET